MEAELTIPFMTAVLGGETTIDVQRRPQERDSRRQDPAGNR